MNDLNELRRTLLKGGTGQVIPAHFIKQLSVGLNGKTVIAAQWGGATVG